MSTCTFSGGKRSGYIIWENRYRQLPKYSLNGTCEANLKKEASFSTYNYTLATTVRKKDEKNGGVENNVIVCHSTFYKTQ